MDNETGCTDELLDQNMGHAYTLLQVYMQVADTSTVSVANCSLCEVVRYCADSNRTTVSVHYTEYSRMSIVEEV